MRIDILTLFPDIFTPLRESIIGRAVNSGKLEINVYNIRDYSKDKHKKCDDAPYGGGAGMVMMPEPIADCIESVDPNHEAFRLYTSPKGVTFNQTQVAGLIEKGRLLILCGHYEGVDQRVIDLYFDGEISIGDYVLTGGELPAMVITDCVSRYVDGVINSESLTQESFTNNLLEYPQYTRPRIFKGMEVPEVLIGGNHGEVDKWRLAEAIKITKKRRPDILAEDKE